MKAKKSYSQVEVDEYVRKLMTDSEIALSKQSELLEKQKKENLRLSRELEEYKKKEKSISRLLVLSERKAKFLETNTRSRCAIEIERLARLADKWDQFFDQLNGKYKLEDKQKLDQFKEEISLTIDGMMDMQNLCGGTPLSDTEKEHIQELGRLNIIKDKKQSELDNRFSKLLSEFNMKIGDNATRGRGRPKKGQSVTIKEAPKKGKKKQNATTTVYPPVGDSGFDFEEALNPTDSLEDIMKELMK